MKKIVILICIICLTLVSCKNVDSNTNNLSDENLIKGFEEAEIAYSWFTGLNQIGINNNSKEINGALYYEVEQGNIKSLEDLTNYIGNYFDEETVKALINTKVDDAFNLFVEEDSKLYCFGGYVSQYSYDIAKKEYNITKENSNKYVISVNITCVPMEKEIKASYEYTYEKVASNKWVFTNYQLPALYCLSKQE